MAFVPTAVALLPGLAARYSMLARAYDKAVELSAPWTEEGAWIAACVIGFGITVATSFSLRQSACGMAVFDTVLKQYQDELSVTHLDLVADADSK